MGQLTPPQASTTPAVTETPPAAEQTEQGTLSNASVQDKLKSGAADPTAPVGDDIADAATAVHDAVGSGDMPTIYRTLSRSDRAEILAYYKVYFGSFDANVAGLGEIERVTALSYAHNGKADLYCKVLIVTRGMYGTDEDTLFRLLETAPPAEMMALVLTDTTWLNELSGAQLERAAQSLRPYREALWANSGPLSPEASQILFDEMAKAGPSVADLLARLEARRGWMDDDEAGMLEDVRAWAEGRPQLVVDPTLSDWLKGQLSDAQYVEAMNTLRTGNKRTLDDKVDEANAETSMFGLISNPDEQKIYDSIAAAPADERAGWAATPEAAALGDNIGSSDAEHAMALVAAPDKESASHLDALLTALEGITYVSDAEVFAALDKMPPAEIVRIRTDAGIRETIEASLSTADVSCFHEIVGYDLNTDPAMDEESQAAELQKSATRMVARVEVAAGTVIGCADYDAMLVAMIDWQRAGGRTHMPADSALSDRFAAALPIDLGPQWHSVFIKAFWNDYVLSAKDRLQLATVDALGTDDAATDASIESVGDGELLKTWSNLPDFAAQNGGKAPDAIAAASAGWVPDIGAEVRGWLEGDRSGALTDVGKIREKIVAALKTPDGAKLALETFGYAADARGLALLRSRQAEELQQRSRGDTILNDVSSLIVDPFTATDDLLDQEYGEYQGATTSAMQTDRGSAQESPALAHAETERQEFLTAQQAYEDLRSSTAEIAGSIVTAIGAVIGTIATAGSASPLAAGLCAGLLSSLFGEMTKAAIQGEYYDPEKGAMALTQALVTGLIAMPLEPLAAGLSGGIAATRVAKTIVASAEEFAPGVGGILVSKLGKVGLDVMVKDFPTNYVGAAMETEGLLRQGLDGALPVFQSTVQDAALGLVVSGVQHKMGVDKDAIERLAHAGKWDANLDALMKAGVIDVFVTTASERLISGEPLEPQDFVALVCKTVEMLHGAHADAEESKTSMTDAVKFFNTATPDQLAGLNDAEAVQQIIAAREVEKFKTVNDLLDVKGFDHEILLPAATAVLEDLEEKRKAAPAATAAPTPTPGAAPGPTQAPT